MAIDLLQLTTPGLPAISSCFTALVELSEFNNLFNDSSDSEVFLELK
jgi:hypothetical protein